MADTRDESKTTNSAATDTIGNTPQVQVYDTNKPSTAGTNTSYTTSSRTGDIVPAQTGPNWGVIILAILVVLALILLVWWLM